MEVHDPQAEQFDARVAEAVHDVPVPEGLAQRLVAAIQDDVVQGHTEKVIVPGRRVWMIGTAAGAIACAASVLVAMWLWPQTPDVVSAEDVIHNARALHQQGDGAAKDWQIDTAPPRDYPLGGHVVGNEGAPWRHLAGRFFGRRGVAYRLTGPRNVRATLLVIDRRGAASAPQLGALLGSPLQNALTTDGCTTAAWIEGARLYVLVVDGDLRAFRSLVRELGSMA